MLFLAAAVVILGVILMVTDQFDQNKEEEETAVELSGVGVLQRLTWNGQNYRQKPAVTVLLIAGVDKDGDLLQASPDEYRSGGQSDFLLLLAIDHTGKQIHQLQIDRDTMAEIDILNVFGREAGTRVLQICLAHSYGDTPKERARHTVNAVERLLSGITVDGYYIMDFTAVPVFNDALGGVTVTIPADMTSVNPAWTEGARVTLHGLEAETFVRTRKTVGEGSNRERMERQNEFMSCALAQMNKRLSDDLNFSSTLLSALRSVCFTNLSENALLDEVNRSYKYEVLPVDHPTGTYSHDQSGFVTFEMDKDSAQAWIVSHLYEPVN